jgi:hypothetical protein
MFLIVLASLVMSFFQVVRYLLFEGFLCKELRSKEHGLAGKIFHSVPITIQKSCNLLPKLCTWWYSVHDVRVLSALRGLWFEQPKGYLASLIFTAF